MREERTLFIDGRGNPRRQIVTYLSDTPTPEEVPLTTHDAIDGYPGSVVVDETTWNTAMTARETESQNRIPTTVFPPIEIANDEPS